MSKLSKRKKPAPKKSVHRAANAVRTKSKHRPKSSPVPEPSPAPVPVPEPSTEHEHADRINDETVNEYGDEDDDDPIGDGL